MTVSLGTNYTQQFCPPLCYTQKCLVQTCLPFSARTGYFQWLDTFASKELKYELKMILKQEQQVFHNDIHKFISVFTSLVRSAFSGDAG